VFPEFGEKFGVEVGDGEKGHTITQNELVDGEEGEDLVLLFCSKETLTVEEMSIMVHFSTFIRVMLIGPVCFLKRTTSLAEKLQRRGQRVTSA